MLVKIRLALADATVHQSRDISKGFTLSLRCRGESFAAIRHGRVYGGMLFKNRHMSRLIDFVRGGKKKGSKNCVLQQQPAKTRDGGGRITRGCIFNDARAFCTARSSSR